jgi:hypothetical protein
MARSPGYSGDGGPALDATLHGHTAQKADPGSKLDIHAGMLVLADTVNGVIREIDLDAGTIETIAGVYTSAGTTDLVDPETEEITTVDAGSVAGYSGDGGDPLAAVFSTPRDVAYGLDGEIYVADTKNNCVRVISADRSTIDTFAGTCGVEGFAGDDGPALESELAQPFGLEVDRDGNVFIADTLNQVIRRVKR